MIAFLYALLWMLAVLPQGDLEAARSAYLDGRYGEAQRLFEAALERPGAAEGPLLYNIGNCAHRLGHHADAVLAYRRALLRLPGDARVRDNLALAERELGIYREPDRSLAARIAAWLDGIPAGTALWLCAALQGLGLAGLLLLMGPGARVAMAGLVVLGLAGGARLAHAHWFPEPPDGVVLADEIALRAEPHREVGIVLVLQAGELVRVDEHSDRWARLTHPRGGGWAPRAGVGLVQ